MTNGRLNDFASGYSERGPRRSNAGGRSLFRVLPLAAMVKRADDLLHNFSDPMRAMVAFVALCALLLALKFAVVPAISEAVGQSSPDASVRCYQPTHGSEHCVRGYGEDVEAAD